jgi:hypothetical protein
MWNRYTMNVIRFGIVEIHLNSKITVVGLFNGEDYTFIDGWERFAEESAFFNHIRNDVESKGGEVVIKWGSRNES